MSVPQHKFARMLHEAKLYEETYRKSVQKYYDYYDGEQWDEEDKYEIEARGQQATVINLIRPTVEMVCALEKERTMDVQIVGREGGDDDKAMLLTELLKQVLDESQFDYYDSVAFLDGVIGGRGWIGAYIEKDETGKKQIKVEHVPWEEIYIDPYHRKPDGTDARYIIRVKWIDRDEAKATYKDKADDIQSAFDDDYKGIEYEAQTVGVSRNISDDYFDNTTNRMKICECYYTVPEWETKKIVNELTGKEEESKVLIQKVHHVVFSGDIILKGSAENDAVNKNPLKVNCYPWIPVYMSRDRKGIPVGIVRNLMDLQDQFNKLNSKFCWNISANRLIVEEDATDNIDELHEEIQKPNGLAVLNSGGLSKVRLEENLRDLNYLSTHMNFMLAMLQRISGVNDSTLGFGGTNERSGVIQQNRIAQGSTMQMRLLENLNFSKVQLARLVLRLIGEFYTDYRIVRVTGDLETISQIEFNKPETYIDETDMKEKSRLINPIDDIIKYDVIFKRVTPFSSVRERQMQLFSEVFKSGVVPPAIASKLMITWADEIPNKRKFIEEIENYYAQQQQMAVAQMQQKQNPQAQ